MLWYIIDILKLASLGDEEAISINLLIIIIKSKDQSFPLLLFLPWLCGWGGCAIKCCQFNIYPGEAGVCFFYYRAVLWSAQIVKYIIAWRFYSFVCTLHNVLSSSCRCIWRLKVLNIENTCQAHSVRCVSKIKSIPSIIFHAIYGAVCIQLTLFSFDDCKNMCTLSYYHYQIRVWPICHCLGLGQEPMLCAVCLSIFFLPLLFISITFR